MLWVCLILHGKDYFWACKLLWLRLEKPTSLKRVGRMKLWQDQFALFFLLLGFRKIFSVFYIRNNDHLKLDIMLQPLFVNGYKFFKFRLVGFSQKKMNSGIKNLVLAIGGPYGFSDSMYAKSTGKISLSKMTFSHQMVRLFIIEQIYRGFTILKNEPYHHQ